MTAKVKTINLSYPWADRDSNRVDLYRVETITDSVEFQPHEMLKRVTVEELCMLRDWRVVIKPLKTG